MAPTPRSQFQQLIAPPALRSYLAEFISTFLFVFVAVGSGMSASMSEITLFAPFRNRFTSTVTLTRFLVWGREGDPGWRRLGRLLSRGDLGRTSSLPVRRRLHSGQLIGRSRQSGCHLRARRRRSHCRPHCHRLLGVPDDRVHSSLPAPPRRHRWPGTAACR